MYSTYHAAALRRRQNDPPASPHRVLKQTLALTYFCTLAVDAAGAAGVAVLAGGLQLPAFGNCGFSASTLFLFVRRC